MSRKIDLEKNLKGLDCGPSGRVKDSVMEAYAAEFGSGGRKALWQRSVPLYKAAAAALIIAVLSGLGGGLIGRAASVRTAASHAGQNADSLALVTLKPVIAPGDAFR